MLPPEMIEARQMLDRSLENTRGGLSETRRALKALRSQPLEDLGLRMAIEGLARDAASRAGVALDLDLPPESLELDPDEDQCVYRIAQEALENVVHHAQATRVAVNLTVEAGVLRLVVRDNGLGFSAESADWAERFGVRGMEERARMVGGRLHLQSSPQAGTTVALVLKVRDDQSTHL